MAARKTATPALKPGQFRITHYQTIDGTWTDFPDNSIYTRQTVEDRFAGIIKLLISNQMTRVLAVRFTGGFEFTKSAWVGTPPPYTEVVAPVTTPVPTTPVKTAMTFDQAVKAMGINNSDIEGVKKGWDLAQWALTQK